MAAYFASDMHLRLDRPERARRLARWVRRLSPDDALYLVGDVCDFWFAARQRLAGGPLTCPGLRALGDFRASGGSLTILPGNHDASLGPFYRDALGATFAAGPLTVTAYGLTLHLTHGHRVGGRPSWKRLMEGRAFLGAFSALPGSVANRLDRRLDQTNEARRVSDEARLLPYYYEYSRQLTPRPDVAVFGHVHTPLDDRQASPRLVALGGWHHESSFLTVDDRGARLTVETDDPA